MNEFPPIKFANATSFYCAWSSCENLMHFPPNIFDDVSFNNKNKKIKKFEGTWEYCNLTYQSIENILTSINNIKIYNETPELINLGTRMCNNITISKKLSKIINSLKTKNWIVFINNICL